MEVVICDTPAEGAEIVAREILALLEVKPDLVLGLATGSTPIGIYRLLIEAHRKQGRSFSRVRTFNLDEYIGLPEGHEQSYRVFMEEHLFGALDIPPENIHFPPGRGPGLLAACEAYDEAITRAGGIDIQILGIGSNGHIGFNEPTSSLRSKTRVKTLADKTVADNSRFFDDGTVGGCAPPEMATTMGIGNILEARKIYLQAFGGKKAEAVQQSIEGPISSLWPGSALQFHDATTFILDKDSAGRLSEADYYRRTRRNALRLEADGLL